MDSLAEEKARSEISRLRDQQEAELRKIQASDESMRRRLHDDLEQTKEMKQAVIEKLMDELADLQRQLAEVQANTPCATPKEKKSMHAAAAGILQSDEDEDEEDERRKMTTTDLDAARASVEAMNKQAEELKGMHDESERARESLL